MQLDCCASRLPRAQCSAGDPITPRLRKFAYRRPQEATASGRASRSIPSRAATLSAGSTTRKLTAVPRSSPRPIDYRRLPPTSRRAAPSRAGDDEERLRPLRRDAAVCEVQGGGRSRPSPQLPLQRERAESVGVMRAPVWARQSAKVASRRAGELARSPRLLLPRASWEGGTWRSAGRREGARPPRRVVRPTRYGDDSESGSPAPRDRGFCRKRDP